MSTIAATNLKNPSSGSNNVVLNADGTIGGAALAAVSDVNGVNTTGTITSGTASLAVGSATGITSGMYVSGQGIAPGTTVSNVVGTTVTLSANAGATLSAAPVTFYSASKILTPGVVGGQLCRAWVSFNGTGTVAIRASYNVSSITDSGAGDYTVNFTTALPDANYAVAWSWGGTGGALTGRTVEDITPRTALLVRLVTANTAGALLDPAQVNISIFR